MGPSTRLPAWALVAAILPSTLLAQGWRHLSGGGAGSTRGGLVYDEERAQLVRFGGAFERGGASGEHYELSVFDGVRWVRRSLLAQPTPLGANGLFRPMVFDSVRRTVLLCNDASRDMWEWNGSSWNRHVSVARPPQSWGGLGGCGFAFDRARGRAVLPSVSIGSPMPFETWEWDAATGWQRASTNDPVSIEGATFVPTRGRVVGVSGRDLWEWSGTAWTRIAAGLLPSAQFPSQAVAWDSWRQRLIIVDTNVWPVRVCEWDGTALTTHTPAFGPRPRLSAALTFDPSRGHTVLNGGSVMDLGSSDTWAWDGVSWRELAAAPVAGQVSLAFDQARLCMVALGSRHPFGSVTASDTWEDGGTGWQRRTIATSPFAPMGPIVFDSARSEVLLVPTHQGASTHRWNGTAWNVASPTTPGGVYRTIAFDAARAEVVLFSGSDGTTWLWNGVAWRQATPAASPAARGGHAMAYDPLRQRTVLFGGVVASVLLSDTWEWDGQNWVQGTPSLSPTPRTAHAMAFDPRRGGVVMTGGQTGFTAGGGWQSAILPCEPWVWNGTNWSYQPLPGAPLLAYHAMEFDPLRGALMLHGGVRAESLVLNGPTVSSSDTLLLVDSPLPQVTMSAGLCPGLSATVLRPESEPFLGAAFALQLATRVPNSVGAIALAAPGPMMQFGGCFVLSSPVAFALVITNPGGAVTIPLAVPSNPALLRAVASAQGALFDATHGFRASNTVQLTVGN